MASAEHAEFVGICGSGHKANFFCSNCIRLFCGDCCSRTHRGDLRGHEWEEIKDRLIIEAQKEEHLVREIQQLSESAETAAIVKDTINQETNETLSVFIAQVERLLMSAQTSRDAQFLRKTQRDCDTLLQRVDSIRKSIAAQIDTANALVTRLAINASLEKELEQIKNELASAAGGLEPDIPEAIYEAAIALNGLENLEGLHPSYLTRLTYSVFLFLAIYVVMHEKFYYE